MMKRMTTTRWLSGDQQGAWRAYVVMQGRLNARLGAQLQADSELSLPDFEVLVHLTDAPEHRLRISELARVTQWEKSRVSHHLRRMEKRGLVARAECISDARGAFVVLTDAGRRAIEEAAPRHVATVRRLFLDCLSDDETRTLTVVFRRVLDRLDAEERSGPGPR